MSCLHTCYYTHIPELCHKQDRDYERYYVQTMTNWLSQFLLSCSPGPSKNVTNGQARRCGESPKKVYKTEQSALVSRKNTYIPLLTQVSEQLPPNIPARCSPLKV